MERPDPAAPRASPPRIAALGRPVDLSGSMVRRASRRYRRRALAWAARADGVSNRLTAARSLPWLGLPRLALLRVDLRDGFVRESSSVAVARLVFPRVLRRAVIGPPARRSLADTPARAVSTYASRRSFSGRASARSRASEPRPTRRPMISPASGTVSVTTARALSPRRRPARSRCLRRTRPSARTSTGIASPNAALGLVAVSAT
jgi:hypothetical protein